VFVPMLGLLIGLGTWQIRRAHAKEALLAAYEQAAHQEPQALDAALPASDRTAAVRAAGSYVGDRALLLDNQSHDGRPGYHVWTPFRLANGGLAIVDRGWIARPASDQLPDPPAPPGGPTRIRGLWRTLPKPGLRLGSVTLAKLTQFPAVVEYPTADDLRTLLGEQVLDGVLLLDPAEPAGFVREWNPVATFPPSRHYGYAVQWFGLAAALVVLFVIVNRKPA
jgi:surfeit locus 1 family protein